MGRTHRTSADTRKLGLTVAVTLALISFSVVAYFIVRGTAAPTDASEHRQVSGIEPIDIDDGDAAPGLGGGSGANIDIVDKSDPTRLAARLLFNRMQPVPDTAGRYDLTQPSGWIYQRNGTSIHIRAEQGVLNTDDIRRPRLEAGTLTGDVVIRYYERKADGSPVELDADTPALTFTSDSLAFDFTIGELSTPDNIRAETAELVFEGYGGLKVVFSQVRERIQFLEVARGGFIHYTVSDSGDEPSEDETTATSDPAPIEPAPATPNPGEPVRVAEGATDPTTADPDGEPAEGADVGPRVTLYHAIFHDDVLVRNALRAISGDELHVWSRVIDNKLPEGAIAGYEQARAPTRPIVTPPLPLPVRALATALAFSQDDPDAPVRVGEQDVLLTWEGRLELRPLEETPVQLIDDHVALAMTADQRVAFSDDEIRARGWCERLDYGLTTRWLALRWNEDVGPVINVPDGGQLVKLTAASPLQMALNLGTGVGHINGAARLDAFESGQGEPDPEEPRSISWSEQSDFEFESENDQMTGRLRMALFQGNVRAHQGPTYFAANEWMRAEFVPDDDDQPSLRKLEAVGRVESGDGEGKFVQTEHLLLEAVAGTQGESFDPSRILLEGGVRAEDDGQILEADRLEADLIRNDDAQIDVTDVFAMGGITFTRPDGVAAAADRMRANGPLQHVLLEGENAWVGRNETRITGDQIQLDGLNASVQVFGAGTFRHAGPEDEAPLTMDASWSSEMRFNDTTGRLECVGDVDAKAVSPINEDSIRCHTLRVGLEPGSDTESDVMSDSDDSLDEDRRIISVHAFGESLFDEDGEVVKIESRRYLPSDGSGERTLERLLFLESDEVLAHNVDGTLNVPSDGKLLLVDRRAVGIDRSDDDDLRGTALFRWSGSASMLRERGELTMLEGVTMTHERLRDGEVTNLECQELVAEIDQSADGSNDPKSLQGELARAVAKGAVYATSANRELIADLLVYDARRGEIEASATGGNRVTIFDVERGTPTSASVIHWDLINDRIDVRSPGVVTTPR